MPLVEIVPDSKFVKKQWETFADGASEDPVFGRLTKLARRVLNVRLALVSLIDEQGRLVPNVARHRWTVESRGGYDFDQTHCERVALTAQPLRIGRVSDSSLYRENASVDGFVVRSYFGVPILHSDGSVLGTFAVFSDEEREWTEDDQETLVDCAAMVTTEIGFWHAVTDAHLKADSAKAAEDRLVESEYRYRNVIDNVNEVVFQTDEMGRWTFLNPAWEKVTGYSIAESLGTGFFDRVHPEDRATNLEMFAPLIARRKDYCRHEIRYLYKNGGFRWIEVYARLTLGIDGAVLGTSGTMTDITDRYESLKRIAESEVRFRTVVECLGEGLLITGLDDRIQYVNARMAAMTGYAPREMIGRRATEILDFRADREEIANRNLRRARGVLDQYEAEFRRKNGETFWVEVHASPFRDADGDIIGTLSANLDISGRKAAENRLIALTAELQRSNQSLQEFASVASHDLQEPLRKIQTYSDRLRRKADGVLNEAALDSVERIEAAAARMQSLIRDLLLYSRVTTKAQPFKIVDLNLVVAEVLSDLEARVQRTRGVVRTGPLPRLAADPLQMRQLFQNLISNALKFHKPDEAPLVEIRAELIAPVQNDAASGPAQAESICRIYVVDHGIGFDQKYADRIFEVFERLHPRTAYDGTGMGLAICRRIADRHGGSISASSQEGVGTTFTVDLRCGAIIATDKSRAYDEQAN